MARNDQTDPHILRLLAEQRRRVVASLMTIIEQLPGWREMPPGERDEVRDGITAAIGVFYNLARDVARIADAGTDGVVNGHVVQLLEEIHAHLGVGD